MRRFLSVVIATGWLLGASSASAAALPADSLPTGTATYPKDVVSAGRYSFFTQGGPTIGRIGPDGSITQFDSGFDSTSRIAVGPEGVLWYTGSIGNQPVKSLGRMTQSGQLLPVSAAMTSWPTGVTAGPDGNMWAAENIHVAKLAPNGSLIAEYDVHDFSVGFARDLVAGPDGNIWVTKTEAAVTRVTPGGVVTHFTSNVAPSPSCVPKAIPDLCPSTRDITVGPDGALWYSASTYGGAVPSIGRITTTGSALNIPLPAGSQPQGIVGGPDYAVYTVDSGRNVLIRTLGFTGEMSETPIGSGGDQASLGADGRVWVAAGTAGRLDRVQPLPRPTTGNLLVRGDGESGLRAGSTTATVPLAGWATSPNFTAGDFNAAAGGGMLWGGPQNALSYARQIVEVAGQASEIDGPRRIATLSGKVGGFGGQGDHGTLTARFLDAEGTVLSQFSTDPVTPGDLGGVTGYTDRAVKALVPTGTRSIEVEALAARVSGSSNDAFFDDLALTLDPLPAPAPGLGSGEQNGPAAAGETGKPQPPVGGTATPVPGTPGTPGNPKAATLSAAGLGSSSLTPLATGGPTTTASKGGALMSFASSAPTRVAVRYERATAGRRKGKRCVARAKTPKRAKICTRYVDSGSFTIDVPAGKVSVRLTGRVGGRTLPRGSYRVVITPAGGVSTTLALRIR